MIAATNEGDFGYRPWTLNTYLWAEALQRFVGERGNVTNHGPSPKLCEDLIASATEAHEYHKSRSSRSGERLHRIVQQLNQYCDSINVMIQHQPVITSLVWGSFRLILQMTMEYHDTPSVAIDGLEFIVKHIGRWQAEVNVWRESTRVWDGMKDLYLWVLRFMSLTISTLRTGKPMRIVKTFFADRKGKLNKVLAKLKDAASTLDSEARTATLEGLESAPRVLRVSTIENAIIHSLIAKLDRLILQGPSFDEATAGTGDWFFSEPLYRDWAVSQTSSTLVVYAQAGHGKSTLAGKIIQRLTASSSQPILKYFFGASSASHWDSLVSFVADLLCQLWCPTSRAHSCNPGPHGQAMVQSALENRHNRRAQFDFLWAALKASLSELSSFVLVLDGLDECGSWDGGSTLEVVTKHIHELGQLDSSRLIILARPELYLTQIWPLDHGIIMDVSHTKADMDVIIDDHFESSRHTTAQTHKLPRSILDTVRKRAHTEADGSMLWLKLFLDYLRPSIDDDDLHERLRTFPTTVADAYAAKDAEERQVLPKRELPYRYSLLCTVLSSKRCLSVAEVRSLHRLRFGSDITRLTRPFVSIRGDLVTLAHPSARDFLLSQNSSGLLGDFETTFTNNNLSQGLAQKTLDILLQDKFCALNKIRCLILRNIEELPNEDSPWIQHIQEEPGYDYSAKYWYIHVTETSNPSSILLETLRMFLDSAHFVHWAEYITAVDGDNTRVAQTRETLQNWSTKGFEFDATRFVVRPYQDTSSAFDRISDKLLRWVTLKELGNYLFLIGDTKLTWQIRQQVADSLATLLGPDHALSLRALSESAYSCFLKNDMKMALEDYQYLYETQARVYGADKFGTLTALGYRGHAHYYLGQPGPAISSLTDAAEGFRRTLGDSNIETLGRLWNIAIILEAYGRNTEALEMFQRILKERVKIFGRDDLFAVMIRISIGNISRRQNRRDDAFHQLNQAYQTRITIWPKTHYLVVDTAIARAVAFWQFDMRKEGLAQLDDIELDENLMSWFQRFCQCRHLRALLTIQGVYTERAIDILRSLSRDTGRKQYNRALLWSKLDLANLLRRKNHHDEAASLFHNLVRDPLQDPGEDEPDPPRYLDVAERALRFTRKGAIKEADELLRIARLKWAREQDLWFWVGGPRPDTEIMREP